MRLLAAFAAAPALMLTACGETEDYVPEAPVDPFANSEVSVYMCGDTRLEVRFAGNRVRLMVDTQTIDLRHLESSPEGHYEAAGDPLTSLKIEENRAVFELSGDVYPDCEPA